jgi:hypothetical protein
VVECLHGTGWRADDRQGNEAGAVRLTGFFLLSHNGDCGKSPLTIVQIVHNGETNFWVTSVIIFDESIIRR